MLSDAWYKRISIGFGVLILMYVFWRAVHVSITHDEGSTTDLLFVSWYDIMFSPQCFQTANNHILSSLLMKVSAACFGTSAWALRLPNVLAYGFYFAGTFLFVRESTSNNWLRFCGLVLMNSSIYLLDFFSLARGYGLANGFAMFSLGCLLSSFRTHSPSVRNLSFLFAALAAYANFTWLHFYVAICFAFICLHFVQDPSLVNWIRPLLRQLMIPIIITLVLLLLSWKPISFLRQQDEFRWGASSWWEAQRTLARDILYETENTVSYGVQWAMNVVLLLSFLVIGGSIFTKREMQSQQRPMLLFSILFLGVSMLSVVQHYLIGTMYMDGRKATMYISLLFGLLFLLIVRLSTQRCSMAISLASILSLLAVWHFFAYRSPNTIREWWYDENDKAVANYIANHPIDAHCGVAVHWKFYPSFQYYNRFCYQDKFQPLRCVEDLSGKDTVAYYYVEGDESRVVPISYQALGRFGNRILFAKQHHQQNQGQEIVDSIRQKERAALDWNALPDIKKIIR